MLTFGSRPEHCSLPSRALHPGPEAGVRNSSDMLRIFLEFQARKFICWYRASASRKFSMAFHLNSFAAAPDKNERKRFFFCVSGLSAHNETLLKSFVRLLQNATEHEWIFSPTGSDLAVFGQGDANQPFMQPQTPPEALFNAMAQLWVGSEKENALFKIPLPLHFKDVEHALNLIGHWLVAQTRAAKAVETTLPASAITDSTDSRETFQLLRWPPASFLLTLEHRKAAALMLKTPIDLDTMARRSGMGTAECAKFVQTLPFLQKSRSVPQAGSPGHVLRKPPFASTSGMGSVSDFNHANAAPAPPSRMGSILMRIRKQLGLA